MNPAWRLLFCLHRMASWVRYWTLLRFTSTGLAVLACFGAAVIIGTDVESTAAFQAFALLFCLLLVAFCFGWFFRAGFSATRRLPPFGTVGQTFTYPLSIQNVSRRTQRGLTLLEDFADARPAFPQWRAMRLAEERNARWLRFSRPRPRHSFKVAAAGEVALPALRPQEEAEVRLVVTPLQRGVLRYRGVILARPDPLGLFRALIKFSLPQTVLILPRRYPLPPIALPGHSKYQEGGVALASHVGQSEEFVALREYRRGDPLRQIHWRSWAKMGKPIVKEFTDEFFVRHALVLDTFTDHPQSEAFEEAVSVAASFACTIQTQESLLDLLFVGADACCFTAGRGLAHAAQMLEILAAVRVCPEKPFARLEALVLNHISVVSGCVCVLLDWDAARRGFIGKLRASGVPVLVVVILSSAPDKPLEPGPMHDAPDLFHTLVAGQIEEGLARL